MTKGAFFDKLNLKRKIIAHVLFHLQLYSVLSKHVFKLNPRIWRVFFGCLPRTHSKWVECTNLNSEIIRFLVSKCSKNLSANFDLNPKSNWARFKMFVELVNWNANIIFAKDIKHEKWQNRPKKWEWKMIKVYDMALISYNLKLLWRLNCPWVKTHLIISERMSFLEASLQKEII